MHCCSFDRFSSDLFGLRRWNGVPVYKTDKIFDLAKPEYFWIHANVYTEELTIKTKGGHTFYYHIDGYWEPESLKIDDRVIYESNDD